MSAERQTRCFIDSNIWFYAFVEQNEPMKSEIARALLRQAQPYVSTQVIIEVCANLLKKAQTPEEQIAELIESFYDTCYVAPVDRSVLLSASKLRKRYSIAYWDSLIVACALAVDCEVLYSEDMQHGLTISRRLHIVNPFIQTA